MTGTHQTGNGQRSSANPLNILKAGLYITATPIGNLGDITLRAQETLKNVDFIACEDTRVTAKLLAFIGTNTKMMAYHDHSDARVRDRILDKIEAGFAVALVSDAGTPLISDPGYKLVADARARDITVTTIPGPCAAIAALTLSGLPTDKFLFAGFPPNKSGARQTWYGDYNQLKASLVIYESGRRLAASLADAAAVLGNRPVSVSREITKKFEETRTATLSELAAIYADIDPPKGEIVIVIGPSVKEEDISKIEIAAEEILGKALKHMSTKSAAAFTAELTGAKKRDLYQKALEIEKSRD